MTDERVAVIVPAWNAAATIDATLRGVRAQSHRALDIVVIDDGSTDATAAIADAHAAIDPRIRVIRQANAGVAAARNRGIAETGARFVALVDADDLWAPSKIERQLALFASGDARLGLVYCGYAVIDADDAILRVVLPEPAGDVLPAIVTANFVGNGSGALFRRQALVEVGGYDSGLRAMGAQGCEDHLIYFRVARTWRFGVVREPLLGYRLLPDAMSSDPARMLRSHALCLDIFAREWPQGTATIALGRRVYQRWMLERVAATGPLAGLPRQFTRVAADDPGAALRSLAIGALRRVKRMVGRHPHARFVIGTPQD